jgi:hypothetical protein
MGAILWGFEAVVAPTRRLRRAGNAAEYSLLWGERDQTCILTDKLFTCTVLICGKN